MPNVVEIRMTRYRGICKVKVMLGDLVCVLMRFSAELAIEVLFNWLVPCGLSKQRTPPARVGETRL